MSLPCPDNKRLKQLIAESFDSLAGPETAQLAQIEARLTRMARRQPVEQKRPWWPWLLLLTGGAATAWWGVDHFIPTTTAPMDKVNPVVSTTPSTVTTPDKLGERETKPEPVQNGNKIEKPNSPLIYQREQY